MYIFVRKSSLSCIFSMVENNYPIIMLISIITITVNKKNSTAYSAVNMLLIQR
jgi:hypothetical protein